MLDWVIPRDSLVGAVCEDNANVRTPYLMHYVYVRKAAEYGADRTTPEAAVLCGSSGGGLFIFCRLELK